MLSLNFLRPFCFILFLLLFLLAVYLHYLLLLLLHFLLCLIQLLFMFLSSFALLPPLYLLNIPLLQIPLLPKLLPFFPLNHSSTSTKTYLYASCSYHIFCSFLPILILLPGARIFMLLSSTSSPSYFYARSAPSSSFFQFRFLLFTSFFFLRSFLLLPPYQSSISSPSFPFSPSASSSSSTLSSHPSFHFLCRPVKFTLVLILS
jgi:hypothetical protein